MRAQEWTIIAMLAVACTGTKESAKPSPEELERMRGIADETLQAARAEDATRQKVLAEAMVTLGPRADLGPCPIVVRMPYSSNIMPREGNVPSNAPDARTAERLVVDPEDVATSPGRRLQQMETVVPYDVDRLTADNSAEIEKAIRDLGAMKWEPLELTMVVTARADPRIAGGGRFEAGVIEGRAFLYSYTQHAVVCAADFRAQSSELLSAEGAVDIKLKVDLENEGERAAIPALVKAGPLDP